VDTFDWRDVSAEALRETTHKPLPRKRQGCLQRPDGAPGRRQMRMKRLPQRAMATVRFGICLACYGVVQNYAEVIIGRGI
jgi:hypothetical protein